jgi:hypothetical protein
MNHFLRKTIAIGALLLGCCCSLTAQTAVTGDKTAYGLLLYGTDDYSRINNHVVAFSATGANTTMVSAIPNYTYATAGAAANGSYYFITSEDKSVPSNLMVGDFGSKTVQTIGAVEGLENVVNDMSYDYSTNTMYMVARVNSSYSALYTIDLTTAEVQTVGNLPERFFTLASTFSGQLYGISYAGTLYKINKTTAEVEEVGMTGMNPTYLQTMEFDHATKTLYWAATVNATMNSTTYVERPIMAVVDASTGEIESYYVMDNDAQIGGLYIPFKAAQDNAPSAPEQLTVTPAANGVCSATLSWTNPTSTFGDEPIGDITKVEVSRNDEVIATLTDAIPGLPMQYVDTPSASGLYTYNVVVYNDGGKGVDEEVTAYVGLDTPAAVSNLTTERVGADGFTLTWNAPQVGANGGYINPEALQYRVSRTPGDVLAEAQTATTFSDLNIADLDNYTYSVVAINAQGESEAVTTAAQVAGPVLTLPYQCSFSASDLKAWQLVDNNADGTNWVASSISWYGGDLLQYTPSKTNQGDDLAISHFFNFEQGATYKVSYNIYVNGNNTLSFELLDNYNVDAPLQVAHTASLSKEGWDVVTKTFTFTAENGGLQNFAVRATSAAGSSVMYLSAVNIEKVCDHNLAVTALAGLAKPAEGNTYTYTATVANRGTQSESNFAVELRDNQGNTLATALVADELAPEATIEVALEWTVTTTPESLVAVVLLDTDEVANDNSSDPLTITVKTAGSPDEIAIGMTSTSTTYNHPINVYYQKTASQSIYQASEIGVSAGWLTGLTYRYKTSYSVPENVSLKVYVANTTVTDNSAKWLPESDYTLVYTNTLNYESGEHELELTFDNAYYYTGNNLAVLITVEVPKYYGGVYYPYYTSPVSSNKSIYYTNSSTPFSFDTTTCTTSYSGNSSVTMLMATSGQTISGKVADLTGAPMADAEISIASLRRTVKTDAEGNYSMPLVYKGSYEVTCSAFGYPDVTKSVTIGEEDAELNFVMSNLATYSFSGKVVDAAGTAIAGATVKFSGYDDLQTVTDEQGAYSFADVVENESYKLTVSKDWFITAEQDVELSESTAVLDDIVLNYLHYQPVNATATLADGAVTVDWQSPLNHKELRRDSGKATGSFGDTYDAGTTLFGTVFRTPGRLESVSWHLSSAMTEHHIVNIYIYDLDEEGSPTTDLLYSERSVRSYDDKWNSYELSEPVDAPRGCLIAFNYPGYIGLSVDDGGYEYPASENSMVYALDYNNPEFEYVSLDEMSANLLVRGVCTPYADNSDTLTELPAEAPDFWRYNVYRSLKDASESTLLTDDAVEAVTLTDEDWASLASGTYQYSVTVKYPDGEESQPVLTNFLDKDMYSTLNINVQTASTSGDATGATVQLTADNRKQYQQVVDESGAVAFENLRKGDYEVEVSLPGYVTYEQTASLSEFPSQQLSVTLDEVRLTPFNLRVVSTEDGYRLTWNETGDIFDDFEEHEDFAINSPGEVGWNYRDLDGQKTYYWQNYSFKNSSERMAFMVFNPSQASPAMDGFNSLKPYSGSKYLASFASINTETNDMLISPRLNYVDNFTVSFQAKSYSGTDPDTFRVGYSTTDSEQDSFTWLGEPQTGDYAAWHEYSYEIPGGATYVTINNIAEDGFVFMVDDVKIGYGDGMEMHTEVGAPEVTYEVYLDGELFVTTDLNELLFTQVAAGKHIAAVKAVYNSGVTEQTEVEFYGTSATDAVSVADNSLSIFPNPAATTFTIRGDFEYAEIFDLAGNKMLTATSAVVPVDALSNGLYLVAVHPTTGAPRILKLIVKH